MISLERAKELPHQMVLLLLRDSLIEASLAGLLNERGIKTFYVQRAHALLTLWSQKMSHASGATAPPTATTAQS